MLEALGADVVLVPQVDASPELVTGTDIAETSSNTSGQRGPLMQRG